MPYTEIDNFTRANTATGWGNGWENDGQVRILSNRGTTDGDINQWYYSPFRPAGEAFYDGEIRMTVTGVSTDRLKMYGRKDGYNGNFISASFYPSTGSVQINYSKDNGATSGDYGAAGSTPWGFPFIAALKFDGNTVTATAYAPDGVTVRGTYSANISTVAGMAALGSGRHGVMSTNGMQIASYGTFATVTTPATAVLLDGPSEVYDGVPSTTFGVTLDGIITADKVVALSSDNGGTFTPSSLTLTPEEPFGTFTFRSMNRGPVAITASTTGLTAAEFDTEVTAGPTRLMLIGDSLTSQGAAPGELYPIVGAFPGGLPIAWNQGHSGSSTAEWLPTDSSGYLLAAEAIMNDEYANTVSLMLGTNDANTGNHRAAAAYKTNLQAICTHLLANCPTLRHIILQYVHAPGLNYNLAESGWDSASIALVPQYNAKIEELVNRTTICGSSRYPYDRISADNSLTEDGIHVFALSEGAKVIAQGWAAGIGNARDIMPYKAGNPVQTVLVNGTISLTATGFTGSNATWAVRQGAPGGSLSSSSGSTSTYTAPATPGVYHVDLQGISNDDEVSFTTIVVTPDPVAITGVSAATSAATGALSITAPGTASLGGASAAIVAALGALGIAGAGSVSVSGIAAGTGAALGALAITDDTGDGALTVEQDRLLRDLWAYQIGPAQRTDTGDIYKGPDGEDRFKIAFPTTTTRTVTRLDE